MPNSTPERANINTHLWQGHGRMVVPGSTEQRNDIHDQLHSDAEEEWDHFHDYEGDPLGSVVRKGTRGQAG